MATRSNLPRGMIGKKSPRIYNRIRTTLETAYQKNNVIRIETLEEAYNLAKNTPGTVVTDLPVYRAEDLGLPADAKVLLFNDGRITGRQAQARRIVDNENRDDYADLLREAIYENRYRNFYHATTIIGLDGSFSVRAHLLIPEGFENTLYSWMLNFQTLTDEMKEMYADSTLFEDEGDILLYSDPDYFVEGFEDGLALFDRDHNCAALLGMRYFGEHKKGSLTMAWSIADRQGFTACHGGVKRFNRARGESFVMGVFGLSGSGKSTLTHDKHDGKYDITVLHDDAFIINNNDLSTVSMEPSYFDKIADYPTDSPENRFLLTIQNAGATVDEDGLVVPVTEDIRNGNGRAMKSVFWTTDRKLAFKEKFNALFWIMKDESLPPLLKVDDAALASTFGATLATRRTSAEFGADPDELAFVPYANPFRLYPLERDYRSFKNLFANHGVDCYIINTGNFLGKDIDKDTTLTLIEGIVDGNLRFEPFIADGLSYAPCEAFEVPLHDADYRKKLTKRMQNRLENIKGRKGEEALPEEALKAVEELVRKLEGEEA